jgi:amino acid transporter
MPLNRDDPMTTLRRNLGLIEAVGLSISMVGPTVAMAFNVTLAAGVAGTAAPLAFVIGCAALLVVGLSFVLFARRIASAGSAYAYITTEFGPMVGFVVGWTLLLTYLVFGSAVAALVGVFLDAALSNYAVAAPKLWTMHGSWAIAIGMVLAYRDMRLASRLMLALETISVLAITALGIMILRAVAVHGGLSWAPFFPDRNFGWAGVGYAMVFAVLSFGGFEGAATLGEETAHPTRAIPIALLGAVFLTGAFYVFSSYSQVMGYGLTAMKELAGESAPLNALALRYGSRDFATLLDVAAAISAFSCVLSALSTSSRLLFALGRAGLAPRFGVVNARFGTPGAAVVACGAVMLVGVLTWAPAIGAATYFDNLGTIGTLSLILVYLCVTVGAAAYAVRTRQRMWAVFGGLGTVVLLWPLFNSVYPVPAYPGNLWPYVVVAYVLIGVGLLALRPVLGRAAMAEVG